MNWAHNGPHTSARPSKNLQVEIFALPAGALTTYFPGSTRSYPAAGERYRNLDAGCDEIVRLIEFQTAFHSHSCDILGSLLPATSLTSLTRPRRMRTAFGNLLVSTSHVGISNVAALRAGPSRLVRVSRRRKQRGLEGVAPNRRSLYLV